VHSALKVKIPKYPWLFFLNIVHPTLHSAPVPLLFRELCSSSSFSFYAFLLPRPLGVLASSEMVVGSSPLLVVWWWCYSPCAFFFFVLLFTVVGDVEVSAFSFLLHFWYCSVLRKVVLICIGI